MNTPATPNRIFIGMPGRGAQSASAGRALWFACEDQRRAIVRYQCGSLLAANFNVLWATALNMRMAGIDIRQFGMLHDDMGPEDYWADMAVEEMDARSLDVLGVVAPIKDGKGLTSIALDGGNTWEPKCRLTLAEIFRLPETFTAEDVGYPLLINTGCWVCRFDPEWAKQIHFEVNDRIIYDAEKRCYRPQVEPEDWNFSRQLNRLGLKVGVTRKIKVSHRGEMDFPSFHPWGEWQYDQAYLKESLIIGDTGNGFIFPFDVPGWLSFPEGEALWKLARGKSVLEIGSFCGRSTACLAQSAEHVTTVDPHDGRTPPLCDSESILRDTLAKRELLHRVTIRKATFAEWRASANGDRFGLIFIDGNHEADAVADDIRRALPLLAEGGLLAFHDYREMSNPGVTLAVDRFIAAGAQLVSTHNTLAVVKPPALVPQEV